MLAFAIRYSLVHDELIQREMPTGCFLENPMYQVYLFKIANVFKWAIAYSDITFLVIRKAHLLFELVRTATGPRTALDET